jgi:hypothetical protein
VKGKAVEAFKWIIDLTFAVGVPKDESLHQINQICIKKYIILGLQLVVE